MRASSLRFLVAAVAGIVAAGAAGAVTVSGTLAFSASGFQAGAPTDPVSGVIRYSFDNTANFLNAADGSTQNGAPVVVTLLGINLPGSWTPVLTYLKSGNVGGSPVSELFAVGHVLAGTNVAAATDDWRIAFDNASTVPTFREFTYASSTIATQLYTTTTGSVAAVPEPSRAALAACGLAGLALAARRRRR